MSVDLQERTAQRLIAASAKHTLDPDTEVDWEAPLLAHAPFMPWESVSLFDTPLWWEMSPQQRQDLSRHEVASLSATGIWLENLLMRMLLRHVASLDPRSAHVQYALTEIEDECRHSIMFGRMIERLGCPAYEPHRVARRLGALFASTSDGPEVFAAALIGEEILDQLQRRSLADETVQPFAQQVNRVHVVEEARHIGYARGELTRQWQAASAPKRALFRVTIAATVAVTVGSYISPAVYGAVGLDPREAARAARTSPHRREVLRTTGERLTDRFLELGIIGGPSRRVWRRMGLLA
jgi:hypothetical protein